MELSDYRLQLDAIDRDLTALFAQRMAVCREVAQYKAARSLPVLDEKREQEKLESVAAQLPAELQEDGKALFRLLMQLSRGYQKRVQQP